MKQFKSFINEKAIDIKKSQVLNANSYDEALEIIQGMNHVALGSGIFSVVFGGEGKLVVKLSDSGIDGTYWYLKSIKDNMLWASNPHFVRVGEVKTFKDSYGYIAVMEKLDFSLASIEKAFGTKQSIAIKSMIFDYMQWKISNDLDKKKLIQPITHKYPKLAECFDFILDLANKYNSDLDLHAGNVAVRNGTPVIVDPLSASKSGYN